MRRWGEGRCWFYRSVFGPYPGLYGGDQNQKFFTGRQTLSSWVIVDWSWAISGHFVLSKIDISGQTMMFTWTLPSGLVPKSVILNAVHEKSKWTSWQKDLQVSRDRHSGGCFCKVKSFTAGTYSYVMLLSVLEVVAIALTVTLILAETLGDVQSLGQ